MVGTFIGLTQIQKIPDTGITETLTTIGTTVVTIYTVPAGKKAKVNFIAWALVALGANTKIDLKLVSIIGEEKTAVAAAAMVLYTGANGTILTAGQTIQYSGDNAANNGTVNVNFSVTELPA